MPWQEQSTVSLREEFVRMADREGANLRELCARYGVSRPTGYKWLRRWRAGGAAALADRSRRPHGSPGRTAAAVEARVLALREAHPAWGGRKLRARLAAGGLAEAEAPSASTITAILRRHGRLEPAVAGGRAPWRRFERPAPNDLWQADFKGHFALADGAGRRCHPLTPLDDHARFLLGLAACADERDATVRAHLTAAFRRYGLPWAILTDNGPPWGCPQPGAPPTALGVWLIRLGVTPLRGRPHHPQTQGKAERLHRTLKAELLRDHAFRDLLACQAAFDAWRDGYNLERPHEALGLAVPAARYAPSPRPFPEALPPVEYGPGDEVRTVHGGGQLSYRGRDWFVGQALRGERVALRPTPVDGVLDLYYCRHRVGRIDLRAPAPPAPAAGEADV